MDLAARVCTCLVISNRHSGHFEIPFLSLVKPFIKDYFILESCLSHTWLSVCANTFLWNSCLQVFHNQDGEWDADVCVDVSLSQSQSIYQMKEEYGWWQNVFMFGQLLHKRRSSWHTVTQTSWFTHVTLSKGPVCKCSIRCLLSETKQQCAFRCFVPCQKNAWLWERERPAVYF